LELSQSLDQIIDKLPQQTITLLPIQAAHVLAVLSLPFEHRDPFCLTIASATAPCVALPPASMSSSFTPSPHRKFWMLFYISGF
jgi:PIN domain nuclease of toxin-antitoxin system